MKQISQKKKFQCIKHSKTLKKDALLPDTLFDVIVKSFIVAQLKVAILAI